MIQMLLGLFMGIKGMAASFKSGKGTSMSPGSTSLKIFQQTDIYKLIQILIKLKLDQKLMERTTNGHGQIWGMASSL